MTTQLAAALLALAVVTHAGPIAIQNENFSCARRCVDTSKFQYYPGTTYDFDYSIQTQTTMEGAAEDRAEIHIRATAEIEILSKCDLALTLRKVQVFENDPSSGMRNADSNSAFRSTLERFPLRFSFQDGVIEDLCPQDGEEKWALNIKRGVLSVFQNTMDKLEENSSVKENDVTGSCQTEYSLVNKGWYSTTIKKSKDLLGCMDRHGYKSALHTMPYRVPSGIQSIPLMKSSHECQQEIDSGKTLKSATCKEVHVFRPFSKENSGAITTIQQSLAFKNRRNGVSTRQGSINSRSDMFFEHAYGPGHEDQSQRDAQSKLQELCRVTVNDIRPITPRLFSELVYVMKNMDTGSIRELYGQLQQGAICKNNIERVKNFFLDAIPMLQTSGGVEMLKELVLSGDVSGIKAEMWITSLAFIQYPTPQMLEQAKVLLESPKVSETALLPVSSLVNNYCKKNGACADETSVTDIISVLENNIGYGCYVNKKNLEKILLNLRAVGNAGHAPQLVSTLNRCFQRVRNPIEVRVAALDAFRHMPCSADRSEVMGVFKDSSEDHEVRITAYLALMQCPTQDIFTQIKQALQSEQVTQVSSFVWSHLTNLMETSSPQKQAIRAILEDQTLKTEFSSTSLKYSRNYEGSFFFEKINTGAMAESNIIWSQDSYPRSAMLNLTVDLFGNSVNLFEVGGRLEGLNYLLETYLGPYGIFGEANAKTLKKSKANLDQVRGALYMRMFGNELSYKHLTGEPNFSLKSKSFNILDFLIDLSKKHDYSLSQSIMFLDSSIITPTTSGLPLNLTVHATATLDLQASGRMDFRKVAKSPRSMLIEGSIQPSGAVEIIGTMSMDATVTRTGLRMMGTMHSSTSLKGSVEMTRGQVFNAKIDMPQDKMEIIDVRTSFFVINGNSEREQKMITENRRTSKLCSGARLATVTGLQLCGEISYPNASMTTAAPYFPLTGPVALTLALHKTDSHTGYNFLAKHTSTKSNTLAQLAFTTPGGKVDRTLSFDLVLKRGQKKLDVSLISPWKRAALTGAIKDSNSIKGVEGSFILDDKSEYAVTAQVQINRSGKGASYKYIPLLEIRRSSRPPVTLTGTILRDALEKADLQLTLSGVTKEPMKLQTTLVNSLTEKSGAGSLLLTKKQEYSMAAGVVHNKKFNPKFPYRVKPTFYIRTPKTELASLTGSAEYKHDKYFKSDLSLDMKQVLGKPLRLKTNLKKYSKGKRQKVNGNVIISSKRLSAKVSGAVDMKGGNAINTRLVVDYNMPRIKKNRITFNSKFNDRSTNSLMKYSLNANFDVKRNPEYNFIIGTDFNHNKRHTEGELDLRYGEDFKNESNRIFLGTTINRKYFKNNVNVQYKGNAQYLPLGVDVQVKGNHKHGDSALDSDVSLQYAKGKSAQASLKLKDDSKKLTKMSGDLSLSYPGKAISFSSDIIQKSRKNFQHSITLRMDKSHKSSMVTSYASPRASAHKLTSDIQLHSFRPIRINGFTNLVPSNFKATGELQAAGKTYSLSTATKYTKGPKGKWTLELVHPSRKINVEMEGSQSASRYDGKLDARWGGDKSQRISLKTGANIKSLQNVDGSIRLFYPTRNLELNFRHKGGDQYRTHADFSWTSKKKVEMDVTFRHDSHTDRRTLAGTAMLITPFSNFEKISTRINYDSDRQKYSTNSELTWAKGRTLTAKAEVQKPVSIRNLDVTLSGTSPFRGYRSMGLTASHKLDPNFALTLTGALERKKADLTLTAEDRSSGYKRDMVASLALASNIAGLESLMGTVSHKDDWNKFTTDVTLDHNGRKYAYDLDMSLYKLGWQLQSTGTLRLTSPSVRLNNKWQHRNTEKDIKTSFTFSNERGQEVNFNLAAEYDNNDKRKVSGTMNLQTPWRQVRNIEFRLKHEDSPGFVLFNSEMKKNRKILTSSSLNWKNLPGSMDLDFFLTNPFTHDIFGKINSRHSNYPLTGHAELQWTPTSQMSIDGSLMLDLPTFDGSIRLSTPFQAARMLVGKATNKKEGEEWISTGSMEKSGSEAIRVESRVRWSDLKSIRMIMDTPFTDLKRVEGGVEIAGQIDNFNSKVDLTIQPHVGRYSGELAYRYLDNQLCKLRVETPLLAVPYFQVTASHEDKKAKIEIDYRPNQILNAEVAYNLDTPYLLDAKVRTPFAGYEQMNAQVSHDHRQSSLKSHAEISYNSYDKIEGDLTFLWTNSLEGSLVVKTPFQDYEANTLTVRHSGDLSDFNSHGEMSVAKKNYAVDASFKSGYATAGNLELSIPVTGYERIKATFNKRGPLRNFRSRASLEYGTNSIQSAFQFLMNSRKLKSDLSVQTPYTQNIELTIDHEGELRNFQSKLTAAYGADYSITSQATASIYSSLALNAFLNYRLPEMRKDLSLTLNHDGRWSDMTTRMSGKADDQEVILTTSFKSGLDTTGSLTFISPFQGAEDIRATFSQAGSLDNFRGSISLDYDHSKKIEASLNNQVAPHQLNTDLRVKSPFFDDVTVLINHDGLWRAFTTKLSGSIGQIYTIESDTNFRFNKDLSVASSLEYRLPSFSKKMTFNMDLEGKLSDMKGNLNMRADDKQVLLKTALKTGQNMRGSLKFQSPFQGLENIEASISKRGPINNFRANAELEYADQKKMETSLQFRLAPKSLKSSMKFKCPSAENVAMSVKHDGTLSSFQNELSMSYGQSNKVSSITTFNYDTAIALSSSLNYKLAGSGRQMSVSFGKEGTLNDLKTRLTVRLDKEEAQLKGSLKLTDNIQGEVSVKTPFEGFRDTGMTFDHSGDLASFTTHANVKYMDNKAVDGKISLTRYGLSHINARAEISTPFLGFQTSRLIFTNDGPWYNMKSHGEVEFAETTIQADADFKHGRQTTGNFILNSPSYSIPSMKLTFSREGQLDNFRANADASYDNSNIFSSSVNHKYTGQSLDTALTMKNLYTEDLDFSAKFDKQPQRVTGTIIGSFGPYNSLQADAVFTNRNGEMEMINNIQYQLAGNRNTERLYLKKEGDWSDFKTTMSGKHNENEAEATATFKNTDGIMSQALITLPFTDYRKMGVSFQHQNTVEGFRSEGKVRYNEDESQAVVTFSNTDKLQGEVKISTPFSEYGNLGASFQHSGSLHGFNSEARLSYNDKETQAVATFYNTDSIQGDLTIMTPFSDYQKLGLAFRHDGSIDFFNSNAKIVYNNEEARAVASFRNEDTVQGDLSITVPFFQNFQNLGISFHHTGELNSFNSEAKLNYNGKEIQGIANFKNTDSIQSDLTITTPFDDYKNIGMSFQHSGGYKFFNSDVKMNYNQEEAHALVTFKNSDDILGDLTITTPIEGYKNMEISFHHSGGMDAFNSEGKISMNGQEVQAITSFKNTDALQGELTLNTPFTDYTSVGLSFRHSGIASRFNSQAKLRYMDGQEVLLKGNFYNDMWRRLGANAELSTPFSGYEYNKIDYTHRGNEDGINCNAVAQFGRGQQMTGVLRMTYTPKFDLDLKLQTPIPNYEDLSLTASFDQNPSKYNVDGMIKIGHGITFSLDSKMDYSSYPMTASLEISTPFENFRKTEVSVSHDGPLDNFRSSASFSSPMTDSIQGEASLQYTSLLQLDARASLTSKLENMEALKTVLQNSQDGQNYRSHVELGWAPDQEIVMDGNFKNQESWYQTIYQGDVTVSTPFDILKTGSVRMEHGKTTNKYSDKVEVSYNGDSMLDLDTEFVSGPKYEISATVRKPEPMQLMASGSVEEKSYQGEMLINWNRDEPSSNIRIQGSYSDKDTSYQTDRDISIKFIHPYRTMGLEGSVLNSVLQSKSHGSVIWDEREGQVFSYNLDLNDRSRRSKKQQDGSFKLTLPIRSLQWTGSYSDSSSSKIMDASFLWDADKDQNKQVGIKASLEPGQVSNKVGMTLTMPSIGKEVKIGSEVTVNQGRTLFDGKTEFSYSPDTRKTLVLTSKLEDVSYGHQNSNYSLSLGIAHPYTDIDVQFKSHVGSDQGRMSAGLDMKYLTASRQRKNLALRGEIDQLKKQINLMMDTPIKKIQITGEVDTNMPYAIHLRNVYDDSKMVYTDVTLDTEKRKVDFSTTYDLDNPVNMFHLSAAYVNSSMVQVEAYRDLSYDRVTDVTLALQLTSPHILQSRLHWRPQIFTEMETFSAQKLISQSNGFKTKLSEMNQFIGQELEGKYKAIASSLKEETEPFINMLDSELIDVDRDLDNIRREIRRMERRNDFFFKDIGMEDSFLKMFDSYKEMLAAYKQLHADAKQSITDFLNEMENFPIKQKYHDTVDRYHASMHVLVDRMTNCLSGMVAKIDDSLIVAHSAYTQHKVNLMAQMEETINSIQTHPVLVKLRNSIPDMERYIEDVHNKLKSSWQAMTLPERYTGMAYQARDLMNAGLARVLHNEEIEHLQDIGNEVYQQGVWAYNYWQVEEGVKQHLKNIFKMLEDMIQEEIQRYRSKLDFLQKSRVTVYDPQQGDIQMDIYLPIPLESLDTLPDISAYTSEMSNMVDKYIPDTQTIVQLYKDYFPNMESNNTIPVSLDNELKDYMLSSRPVRKVRRLRSRKA